MNIKEGSIVSTVEELSEVPCCICNDVVIEYSIPNDVWNKIFRENGSEHDKEYLCITCFLKKVVQQSS